MTNERREQVLDGILSLTGPSSSFHAIAIKCNTIAITCNSNQKKYINVCTPHPLLPLRKV
ncbi:hypothetical protein Mapa_016132 [Marchantia paleacea]|nr:hypothetical protein Mapa_016132 [Marchantia paleacea]